MMPVNTGYIMSYYLSDIGTCLWIKNLHDESQ